MKTLQYVGKFQVVGLYEVQDDKVEELLETGLYVLPKEDASFKVKVKKERKIED